MFMFLMRGKKNINALKEMHALEVAAETIYRRQMWRTSGELRKALIHASENEKKHRDELKAEILAAGAKPSLLRVPFYIFGTLAGFVPSLLGRWTMMMTNILFETQAVYDYLHMIRGVEHTPEHQKMLERNIEDEKEHIITWEAYLWEVPLGKTTRKTREPSPTTA
jgi:demethoxyubiquinone hydroxylase (CLK1/Coq7/Cat5 family)